MNALLILPLLSVMAQAKAKVTILTDTKPGQVISGEYKFTVRVQANDPVTQVEFYVGSDLRDSDTSTPYEFRLDTLSENDGPIKVAFKAYTSEGETGEKTLSLKIDNQLSKGAPFHVDRGNELLTDNKWAEALTAGRIALKIDPQSNGARLVLARANLGLGVLDSAQKFVEDAVAQDPKDRQALNLLALVNLKRAFGIRAREGDDQADTRRAIAAAMKAGVAAQRKSADLALDAAGQPTDANLIAYADAAIAAKRFSLASMALKPAHIADETRIDIADRLAYCQIREGLYSDAFQTLNRLGQKGVLDAYGDVLLGIVYAELGDVVKSDEFMQTATTKDASSFAVKSAQAFLALTYYRTVVAGKTSIALNYDRATNTPERLAARNSLLTIANDLAKSSNPSTEVSYYIGALYNRLEDFSKGQIYFQQASIADPLNYDAYIEQANRSILVATTGKPDATVTTNLYENAKTMFDTALTARDDSSEALTGLTLVAVLQNNPNDAIKWGKAATAANPNYASARAALSMAYSIAAGAFRKQADKERADALKSTVSEADRTAMVQRARDLETQATKYEGLSRQELDAASPLDPAITGLQMTDVKSVWRYYAVGGRHALLPAP